MSHLFHVQGGRQLSTNTLCPGCTGKAQMHVNIIHCSARTMLKKVSSNVDLLSLELLHRGNHKFCFFLPHWHGRGWNILI